MDSRRTEQVGQLIKKEISQLLLREIDFPQGTLVTVTRVQVTADMRDARVFVSILPFARRFVILDKLRRQRRELQLLLNDKLEMRFVPKIFFFLDKTEEEASKVEELFNTIEHA